MKILIKTIVAVFTFSVFFSACKSRNEIGKLIPGDVLVAGYFDSRSLLEKLPPEDIRSTQIFKDLYKDSTLPDWSKALIDDPQKMGVDLSKGLVGFADKGTGEDINFVVSGFIGNAGNFESFNKNLAPGKSVSDEKNIKILTLQNNSLVGWNDQNFVYVLNVKNLSNNLQDMDADEGQLPRIQEGDITSAKSYLEKIFSLKENNSLAKDSRFDALLKSNGDIKVWVNNERIFQLSPMGVIGMLKIDDLIKDSRLTYSVNFENGRISSEQKAYYGKALTDLLKKYSGDKIKADEFSKIPSNNVIGALAVNFKPQGIREILKLTGLDGLANMYLNELKVSLDDLLGSVDGKFLLSFSDMKVDSSSMVGSNAISGTGNNILFKVGVSDKEKLQKILDAVLKATAAVTSATPPYVLNEKEFVAGNHKSFTEKYLSGNSGQKQAWADSISGHPFGLYVNINKIIQDLPSPQDTSATKSIAISRSFWKELYSRGGDFSGYAFTFETILTLQNQNENSLKQLNSYLDELYRLNKEKIKDIKLKPENVVPDSTGALPSEEPLVK